MKGGALAIALILAVSSAAIAEDGVPPLYTEIALDHRIPPKLFFALILNESRSVTANNQGRRILPWPWTVHYQGKPYFFQTRQQAFVFVSGIVDRGKTNFDVGLGQINWHWHKESFGGDLWVAFDPVTNLQVAAKYLREQYDREKCNTWEKAVGCYHRPGQQEQDKQIARRYARRVVTLWENI